MISIKEYLFELLGKENVKVYNHELELKLPRMYSHLYKFVEANIMGVPCVFVEFRHFEDEPLQMLHLIKHFSNIGNKAEMEPILVVNHLLSEQRQRLIKNRIPFIVASKQAYLPFIFFSFKDSSRDNVKKMKEFTSSVQLILLYSLYRYNETDDNEINRTEVIDKLKLSKMTFNRAMNQFINLKIVERTGYTRNTSYYFVNKPREIFKKIKGYWINPIKDTIILPYSGLYKEKEFYKAGEYAISEMTLLGYSQKQYAISFEGAKENINIDFNFNLDLEHDESVEIQIWKYDPASLAEFSFKSNMVDPLSLYLSLIGTDDARLNGELDYLLDEILKI